MRDRSRTRQLVILSGIALSSVGMLSTLNHYIRREMKKRDYPSWDMCRCNFKLQKTIFLVYHSRHKQRGETVVSQEWGIPLNDPPYWLRRFLHTGAQLGAILNPYGRYVERVLLNPQQAQHFAVQLLATSENEEISRVGKPDSFYVIWRREVLHVPRHAFDAYTRRLYPVQVSQQRSTQAEPLPALWDAMHGLPLPGGGTLLDMPTGTRIDYIGWTPSQISCCTVRHSSDALN